MFSATYVRQCPFRFGYSGAKVNYYSFSTFNKVPLFIVKLGSTFFLFFFDPKQRLWILTIDVLSNNINNIKTF